MSDIFNLLNIDSESIRSFSLQANLVADSQTEKAISSNMKRLKQIESNMLTGKQVEAPTQIVEDVISRVLKVAESNDIEVGWTTYELRVVANYMMKLQGYDTAFAFALKLLENNWRNMFFNGLVFYVMRVWNNTPKKYRDDACQLITKKLNQYQDKNKLYLKLKNHSNFFDENGTLRFASLLNHRNESILSAPEIIGFKASTIDLAYYSNIIIAYFSKVDTTDLTAIEEVLSKHTLSRTKKLLFANLIDEADKNGNIINQTQISKFASRIMGDISLSSTWAPFNDATEEEKEKLKNARILANKWYARKVIEVFFDICVQDFYRKSFWLKYIEYINDFKISGSTAVKLSLSSDDRINGMIQSHFIETNSRKGKTAALILFIKDKIFVEFSDSGSLYIYNKNNNIVENLSARKFIDSINHLKDTTMSLAVTNYYSFYDYDYNYNDEGYMRHAGYWQDRLDKWFENKLNIDL